MDLTTEIGQISDTTQPPATQPPWDQREPSTAGGATQPPVKKGRGRPRKQTQKETRPRGRPKTITIDPKTAKQQYNRTYYLKVRELIKKKND